MTGCSRPPRFTATNSGDQNTARAGSVVVPETQALPLVGQPGCDPAPDRLCARGGCITFEIFLKISQMVRSKLTTAILIPWRY